MKLATTAALIVGVIATPALAQTTTAPPATTTAPPVVTTPSQTTTTTAPQAQGALQQRWYTAQTGDMRASQLIGTTVRNSAGDNIGDINDILLDSSGRVAAVVVGVGGFLGIGEREVAMSWGNLQVQMAQSGTPTISANMSRDDLRAAPAYQRMGTTPR